MTDPGKLSDDERSAQASSAAAAIDELVSANAESNKTMTALVEHVRRETAARDRKVDALEKSHRQMRNATFMGIAAIVIMLILGAVNALNLDATRRATMQQASIVRKVDQTNKTLLDCLNAQGQCGSVNAASQERILGEVKRYNLIGFYCIRNNPAPDDPKAVKFLACMQRLYPGGPTISDR